MRKKRETDPKNHRKTLKKVTTFSPEDLGSLDLRQSISHQQKYSNTINNKIPTLHNKNPHENRHHPTIETHKTTHKTDQRALTHLKTSSSEPFFVDIYMGFGYRLESQPEQREKREREREGEKNVELPLPGSPFGDMCIV